MIVRGNSITECWLKILIAIADSASTEIVPLVANFSVNNSVPDYQLELENDLNEFLKRIGQNSLETTASTIFPKSLATGDQSTVFERFENIWKHVKKDKQNRNGHYFRRLIAFNEASGQPINQLKHIIDTYNGVEGVRKPVHRRSALY